MKFNVFVVITTVFMAACQAPKEKAELSDVFQQINTEVLSNSEAYSRLGEATSTIGHRLTGSENGTKAEQYAFDLMKSYGFEDVQFMNFEVEAWSRVSLATEYKIGNEEFKTIPSVSLAHSPVSYEGIGELVDLGNGLVDDYERVGDQIKGKFALVYLGILPGSEGAKNLHRSEKTALASQYGASGIVFYNSVPGGILLTGTASVTGKLIDIPAICLINEDGFMLSEALKKQPVSLQLNMQNKSDMVKARNVIATLKGSELPEERVIVGGHLDSWDLATGATDNGIGSFAILDMARTFKALNLSPLRTVEFVMFMGEEQGLLGSKAFVRTEKEAGTIENIKYMMNIDMSGNPTAFSGGGREVDEFFLAVGEKIKAVDSVFTNNFRNGAGLHSDHQPFMLEGIPYTGLVSNLDRSIYRCYHADCDDFDLINEEHIRNSVRFSSMMLYALADAAELPADKLTDEETKEFMIQQGLKEKLVLGGDWKWD